MAASGDGKGRHEFTFVEKLPEKFTCPVCLDAVYDAVETKCCGVLLCMSCSDTLLTSKMACPHCRASSLVANENYFVRREVRQFHIYCVSKDCCSITQSLAFPVNPNDADAQKPIVSGLDLCEWSGEINDLQSHLDNHCPHVAVACQYNCGVKIVRCQKDIHEDKICRKRPFSCWFCDMKATAEEIDDHATKCDKRPIECPNKCPAELLQGELELHLEQCPLQEVSCEFEHAGCKEKVMCKDYDSHIEDYTQKHLRLISAQLAMLRQQTQENEQELVKVKKEIESTKNSKSLLAQVSLLNINIRVALGGTSDPFYVLGYCMSVKCKSVTGSTYLQLHPGQYDDHISWPVKGAVTLLLLHPRDSSKNKVLAYHIDKTQRPTETVRIGLQSVTANYLHGLSEYRLSVKSAALD